MKFLLTITISLGMAASCLRGADATPMVAATNGPDVAPADVAALSKPKDLADPAASYWDAAVKGSPEAAYNLGVSYEKGHGVPQNNAQAEFWFRRAAEAGYSFAETSLGKSYKFGLLGNAIDSVTAREWFVKAARDGDPEGQCWLAACLCSGLGGSMDEKQGVKWLVKSATGGNGHAAGILAALYLEGNEDISKNLRLAYLWSLLAASSGELWRYEISVNNETQKTAEDSLAHSDIVWLKNRRDEIEKQRRQFKYFLVDDGLEESVTVPPEGTVQKSLYAKVHLGDGDHTFFIDTGCTFSFITPELAHKLNLNQVGLTAWQATTPLVCPILTGNGTIDGVSFQNLRFIEMELPADFKALGIEGFLGCNFIRWLRLEIDGKKLQVTLQPPGPDPAGGIPITFQNGLPHVDATVESLNKQSFTVSALLDSGDGGSISMNKALNFDHPFAGLISRTAAYTKETVDGVTQAKMGRVASLKLGSFRLAGPLLGYEPENPDEFSIGMSVLAKFTATFDYANGKLYLTPVDIDVPEPPVVDLGLGYSLSGKDPGIAIVYPDGPAAKAGFEVGDVLETVDGHPLKGLSEAEHKIIYAPGTHTVVVKRDGQEKTLTLVLGPGI
jgi:Sel1 repeat/PDZ domain